MVGRTEEWMPDKQPWAMAAIPVTAAAFAVATVAMWATDPGFQHVMQMTPQFNTWFGLMVSQGAIAGAGLLPAWRFTRGYRTLDSWTRWAILLGIIGTLVLVALPTIILPILVGELPSPFANHGGRMTAVTCLFAMTAIGATAASWVVACTKQPAESASMAAESLLRQRQAVNLLLLLLGFQVGMVTLTTGALRIAIIQHYGLADDRFPVEAVFTYGAYFALVVAIIYLPAYAEIQRRAENIRRTSLESTPMPLDAWLERHAHLGMSLGLKLSWVDTIRASIPILVPLLGALASSLLGVQFSPS